MWTSFKLLLLKPNLRNKVGNDFSRNFNEKELSYSTDYCYFHILLKTIATYATWRNGRYLFYQKDCWDWEKRSSQLKRLQQISFRTLRKNCSREFFAKIQTNSHVSQAGKLLCTQKPTNRKICFAVFVLNQIHSNFNFEELSSLNSCKTTIQKIEIFKVVY